MKNTNNSNSGKNQRSGGGQGQKSGGGQDLGGMNQQTLGSSDIGSTRDLGAATTDSQSNRQSTQATGSLAGGMQGQSGSTTYDAPMGSTALQSSGAEQGQGESQSVISQLASHIPPEAISTVVQALESSAMKLVDQAEQYAVDVLGNLEGRYGDLEQKATRYASDLEGKALSALENVHELPGTIDRSVRSNPAWAIGLGILAGAAARLAVELIPAGTVTRLAKEGAQFAAKTGANVVAQRITSDNKA